MLLRIYGVFTAYSLQIRDCALESDPQNCVLPLGLLRITAYCAPLPTLRSIFVAPRTDNTFALPVAGVATRLEGVMLKKTRGGVTLVERPAAQSRKYWNCGEPPLVVAAAVTEFWGGQGAAEAPEDESRLGQRSLVLQFLVGLVASMGARGELRMCGAFALVLALWQCLCLQRCASRPRGQLRAGGCSRGISLPARAAPRGWLW